MHKIIITLALALSIVKANADTGTNQFDDLVFPSDPIPTNNAPMLQNANPYLMPYPYGNNVPYTISSYPQGYTSESRQSMLAPNNSTNEYNNQPTKPRKPWGDVRYIWPDFYTDQTNDWWDKMINAPHDMGYMPGGWRFPSLSTPDPVTVGDAVANQVPPIMKEVPNFMDFTQ
ncbi:hypothetical protein [Thiofilum flexile]|uniref:hypothetical protein n=1 Tax=Thiofilum flexile TaxID=125627 RepID=UPI00037D61C2|nr:hypothetical protein [Thiofilum flexile]